MGMLYELCPACEGTGTFLLGSGEDAERLACPGCKPLRVVVTGLTAAQAEAAVARARACEDALRELVASMEAGAEAKRRDPGERLLPEIARTNAAFRAARAVLAKRGRK